MRAGVTWPPGESSAWFLSAKVCRATEDGKGGSMEIYVPGEHGTHGE